MTFLDFGSTQFHGIEFTHQDGSTQFVEPHPEVKEEVESLLDRMKTSTAVAQMESHNKQKWLSLEEAKAKEKELRDIEDKYPQLNYLGRWTK